MNDLVGYRREAGSHLLTSADAALAELRRGVIDVNKFAAVPVRAGGEIP